MRVPQFHLSAKNRASDVMAAYIYILCFCRTRFNGPSVRVRPLAPLSAMKFPLQIEGKPGRDEASRRAGSTHMFHSRASISKMGSLIHRNRGSPIQ